MFGTSLLFKIQETLISALHQTVALMITIGQYLILHLLIVLTYILTQLLKLVVTGRQMLEMEELLDQIMVQRRKMNLLLL